MRSSKDRKHVKKRTHKALAASKTEESRQRRLDNKAKRDEIHAINPDAKVKIINQKTYINDIEVAIVNGEINNVLELAVPEAFRHKTILCKRCGGDKLLQMVYCQNCQDIINKETEELVVEKIETKNKNALQRLTDKFRNK